MAEKAKHITINLSVGFDSEPESELPLKAYLFTRAGRLLASAPVTKGKTALKGEAGGRKDLRLFIAPAPPEGEGEVAASLDMMERLQAYEPSWTLAESGSIELKPIPKKLWSCWLRRCRVRGTVVVPSLVGGVWQDLPLPHAKVHICEVDPLWLLLKRIPNIHIFQLRDDLLKILDRTWIPIPNPGPDPDPWFDLGTRLSKLPMNRALVAVGNINKLNPQPEPPSPVQTLDLETAAKTIEAALPQNSRIKLLSSSSLEVRNLLASHLEAFWPVLCLWHWHWPWLWPFLRTWERTAVETDANGTFDTNIWYCPFGDHPDLYFWVDYSIDSAWTPVYKPSVRCHTWWNYPCGTEVTLHVTDPRVSGVAVQPDPPPASVLVERIGDIWLADIQANGTTTAMDMPNGLGPMPHAFGDVLYPHVEFSSSLEAAGVTHYRWSYQHINEDGTERAPGEPWHVVSTPISRIYTEIVNIGDREVWRRGNVSLGPVGSGDQVAFILPPHDPPVNPGHIDAWWDFCRNNEASAFFHTTQAYPDSGLTAGWVKLRLELFRQDAGTLHRVSPAGGFQIPPPDYHGEGDMESIAAGLPYVEDLHDELCDGPDPVQVFVLNICIDNRPTYANIIPATVPGSVTGCTGILTYSGNPDVSIAFNASQPGNHGGFVFGVQLGHLNHQVQASSSGVVGAAGSNGFAYAPAESKYSRNVPAQELLTHNHLLDGCICPPMPPAGSGTLCPDASRHAAACLVASGAFSEVLSVYAAVTNGYDRLWWLDRYDHAGFALVQN